MTKPTQIQPLLDPKRPLSDNRYPYYLLERMHSPPVSTPNAIRWAAYKQPIPYLRGDDPDDDRVAYGFIEYEERLTWADLDKYNMLPFNYDESILYDLWQAFDKNRPALLAFLTLFFRITKNDPGLRRLGLAVRLVGRDWTLRKVKKALSEILNTETKAGDK